MWTDKLPSNSGWYWVKYISRDKENKTVVGYIDVVKKLIRFSEDTWPISSGIVSAWWDVPLRNPSEIYCDEGYKQIEINFPFPIQLSRTQEMLLSAIIDDICNMNCPPGYVMWLGGVGNKPTYIPMTIEDEEKRGPEFDDDILCFEISCRTKFETDLEYPKKKLLDELVELYQEMKKEPEKDHSKAIEKLINPRLAIRERHNKKGQTS